MQMLHDKIAIEQDEAETETASGFVISVSEEKTTSGIVFSAGPGTWSDKGEFKKTTCKPGDRVIFSKAAAEGGETIEYNGKTYLVIQEKDIFGIDK